MPERLTRLQREDLPQFEPIFADLERDQGYVSRSLFMLARDPKLLAAVGLMHDAAWYGAVLDAATRDFAAYAFTMYRGAAYSAAHCANNAERHGLAREKIVSIRDPDAAVYSERERALLAFCHAASSTPGRVSDAIIARLRLHFGPDEIVALTALMAMMSFLSTWNAILATELEPIPEAYARAVLGPIGWTIGPHR